MAKSKEVIERNKNILKEFNAIIRPEHKRNIIQAQLAVKYNVSTTTVENVIREAKENNLKSKKKA